MAKFTWNDKQFTANIKLGSELALEAMSGHLVKDIKDSMGPGSYYEWPSNKKDGSTHWSSQPGDAPSPDTNVLKDSISYSTSFGVQSGVGSSAASGVGSIKAVSNVGVPSATHNEVVSVVGTMDERALELEFGSNFAPRPFIRPAIPRNKEILATIFNNVMKREINE